MAGMGMLLLVDPTFCISNFLTPPPHILSLISPGSPFSTQEPRTPFSLLNSQILCMKTPRFALIPVSRPLFFSKFQMRPLFLHKRKFQDPDPRTPVRALLSLFGVSAPPPGCDFSNSDCILC
jgi:hypothetical protein